MTILPRNGTDVNPSCELSQTPSGAPSRFKLASMTDDSVFQSNSSFRHRVEIPLLKFDLIEEIKRYKWNREETLRDEPWLHEVKLNLGPWIKQELESSVSSVKSYTQQNSGIVCIDKALNRFMVHNSVYQLWDELTSALIANNNGMFPDGSPDYTELSNMRSGFKMSIPNTLGGITDKSRTTFRIPRPLFTQSAAVANRIGMDLPLFLQLMIIDGLRTHPKRVFGEKMDGIIADFYYLFTRRLRYLYCAVKTIWDIRPCENVQRIISELEQSGIVE